MNGGSGRPVQLSSDDEPPGTKSSQETKIAAVGPDRYLAAWGERELQQPRNFYVIRAGLVDCRGGS